MRRTLLVTLTIFCYSSGLFAQTKTISRDQLKGYLSKAINATGLNDLCKPASGNYKGLSVISPEEMADPDISNGAMFGRYSDMLRLIQNVKPKIITDAIGQWGFWDWQRQVNRSRCTVLDIKAIDPDIIVQASLNEFETTMMMNSVGKIPSWVFNAFGKPIEDRYFDLRKMAFSDYLSNPDHRWYDKNPVTGDYDQIVPDISKEESQMWFYFLGRTYIDMGCESITFSQVELMNNQTLDPTNWNKVLTRLKSYADGQPGIRFLLLTGHTIGMKDANNKLAFDFHSCPIRPTEMAGFTNANGGATELNKSNCGRMKIYGQSLGGINPSGWSCLENPGLVHIDNYGNAPNANDWGKPTGGNCSSYNLDEISWFAFQPEFYRNDWLKYAYYQCRFLDGEVFFSLPVKRPASTQDGTGPEYVANPPAGTTFGAMNLGADGLPRTTTQPHYFAGNQEAAIKDILSGVYDINFCGVQKALSDYCYSNGAGWTRNHPRLLADINGDGKKEIVGFGNDGVFVSYYTGTTFTGASLALNYFGYAYGSSSGWNVDNHPRLLGDVNGDGKADIVGFGNDGVYLSLSTGSSFTTPVKVIADLCYNNGVGWTKNHPRFLADANGDGKADIIAFGNAGVYVAYSTGTGFTPIDLKLNYFGYNYGNIGSWNLDNNPRLVGDIDGDGKADIVGFGNNGVYVSYATGGGYTPAIFQNQGFCYNNGWTKNHPRFLADVNGDGKMDIVGFGNDGVYVAYATNAGISNPVLAIKNYGYENGAGWDIAKHPRVLANINGDAKIDIIGFGQDALYASVGLSPYTLGSFNCIFSPQTYFPAFAYSMGWDAVNEPRIAGDIDGDGKDEIVGFGNDGVYVENCVGYKTFSGHSISEQMGPTRSLTREDVIIYPNPANEYITIDISAPELEWNSFEITNVYGSTLILGLITNTKTLINTSNLKTGSYWITLKGKQGKLTRRISIFR